GTTHGEIVEANDLPKLGPNGAASNAWISRADQSLNSTAPNKCSSEAWVKLTSPWGAEPPTINPSSASMSKRLEGPKLGAVSFSGRIPFGRRTGVSETNIVEERP